MGITHGEALLLVATKADPDAPWRWEKWLSRVECFPPWLPNPIQSVYKTVEREEVLVKLKTEQWSEDECKAVIAFLTAYRAMTTAKDRKEHWKTPKPEAGKPPKVDNYVLGREKYKGWVHNACTTARYNVATARAFSLVGLNLHVQLGAHNVDVSPSNAMMTTQHITIKYRYRLWV